MANSSRATRWAIAIWQHRGLEGSAFNDLLIGGVKNDILLGGAGDDTLLGGGGADTIDGGLGFDTVDYSASVQSVEVHLDGTLSLGGDAQGDVISNVEHAVGSQFDDTLVGGALGDLLEGGSGNDNAGGRRGADTLVGRLGSDTASYAGSSAGVQVALDGSLGHLGDAEGDVLSGIENPDREPVQRRAGGRDNANMLTGGLGDDTLVGGYGADTPVGRRRVRHGGLFPPRKAR